VLCSTRPVLVPNLSTLHGAVPAGAFTRICIVRPQSFRIYICLHLLNGPLSRTTQVSRTRKLKPIWILLEHETVGGSGIRWAVCKSAPRSRQITMPAPHHSVFTGRMPFLPPNQQRQSTEGSLSVFTREKQHNGLLRTKRRSAILNLKVLNSSTFFKDFQKAARYSDQTTKTRTGVDNVHGRHGTGSPGHLGHLSRPGHRVIILTRCETRVFPVLRKKCPKCKTYI